jgi:hypothetical protein
LQESLNTWRLFLSQLLTKEKPVCPVPFIAHDLVSDHVFQESLNTWRLFLGQLLTKEKPLLPVPFIAHDLVSDHVCRSR